MRRPILRNKEVNLSNKELDISEGWGGIKIEGHGGIKDKSEISDDGTKI